MEKTEKRVLHETKKLRQALLLHELFQEKDFEKNLLAASADLTKRKQEILRSYYIDFWSHEEIARFYHISKTQVQQELRDCIKKIKKSPKKRKCFQYGADIVAHADCIDDKIQDNAALLIWLNQVDHVLDEITKERDTKIADTNYPDVLKKRLLGEKYELVKDISALDVKRIAEDLGRAMTEIPSYDQIPIEEMGFSARTYNCLKRADCYTLGDICKKTRDQLLRIRNMGVQSAQEVIDVIGKYGYPLQK